MTLITITIITTAIVSIFIWESFRSIYRKWFREEPINHYQPDRHEYPKKEEPTIKISRGREIPNPNYNKYCECVCVGECKTEPRVNKYVFDEKLGTPIIPGQFLRRKKYIGVYKHGKKWQARIKTKGVKTTIGTFDLASEAAKAYNKRAIELRGDKAKINTFDYI